MPTALLVGIWDEISTQDISLRSFGCLSRVCVGEGGRWCEYWGRGSCHRMVTEDGPLSGKALFLDEVFERPHLEQHKRKVPAAKWREANAPQTPWSYWMRQAYHLTLSVCDVCLHASVYVHALHNSIQGLCIGQAQVSRCEAHFHSVGMPTDIQSPSSRDLQHGVLLSLLARGWGILHINIFYHVPTSLLNN